MELVCTERFKRAYRELEPRYRKQVKKALAQLLTDRTHPGLRVEHIRGTEKVWELRAGRDIRVTFEIEKEACILRNVGHHDPTLRNP